MVCEGFSLAVACGFSSCGVLAQQLEHVGLVAALRVGSYFPQPRV